MGEVTNELVYEILKRLEERMTKHDQQFADIRSELSAVRTHMQAIQMDVGNIYTQIAHHDLRFDRIEKRLGLFEPAL